MAEVITNSDLDLSSLITITEPLRVIGSNGTIRYFLPFKQYVFDRTERRQYNCNQVCSSVQWTNTMITYYIIVWDDEEEFEIPEYGCCIENMLRDEYQQDLEKNIHRYTIQIPADWKEEFEKITDIKLIDGLHVNGMHIYMKDPSTGVISEQELLLKTLREKGYHI